MRYCTPRRKPSWVSVRFRCDLRHPCLVRLTRDGYGEGQPFAERHDPLQALGLGRLNKPLGKCVQIWTPGRQDQWLHATAPKQAPKGGGVERVPVEEVLSAALG